MDAGAGYIFQGSAGEVVEKYMENSALRGRAYGPFFNMYKSKIFQHKKYLYTRYRTLYYKENECHYQLMILRRYSMSRQQWVNELFKTVDAMDADRFCGYLTEGARFKFSNAEEVVGRSNIKEAVAGFYSSINTLSHTITDIVEQGDMLVCRGEVTYTRKDSGQVTFPFMNFFRLEGNLVSDYQIYVDASRLYA
jgi:ketosteroid isomerase-like protein